MWLTKLGRCLQPDLLVNSLLEIPLQRLWFRGIRALVVDLDNTTTRWNCAEVGEETKAWFQEVQARGFAVCLMSNNGRARGRPVAEYLRVPLVCHARKPGRRSFLQAMEIMGSQVHNTAVIGDQIFTDVLGGKRLGVFTVLVRPVSPHEFFATRLVRLVERLVMRSWHWRKDCG